VREGDDDYEVAYLCLDPEGKDHIRQTRSGHGTTPAASGEAGPGMTEEQKTERRRVITNNKAWEVAAQVRREYVIELLARRSVPKGTLRYVTEVIMADPGGVASGDGDRVASLVGKESHPGAWDGSTAMALARDANDARLPLVLLAHVAASVEARFGERQGCRHPTPALAGYLRFLATCGYGLSEVEQEVADGSTGER
jgi:ParB family chromosome partitioning protein